MSDCNCGIFDTKFESVVSIGEPEKQEKSFYTEKNGTFEIIPDEKCVITKVTAEINVPERKEEQEKTLSVTANGSYSVEPDEGKVLSKVDVDVNVAFDNIGKPYIDSSKMTYFNSFFANNPAMLDELGNIDTSNGTDFSKMFYGCSKITEIPQIDTSNGTNFSYMFDSCSNLTSIPQLDTGNGTNFIAMFYGCSKITEIPQIDTSNGTNFGQFFYRCYALKTVSVTTAKANFSTDSFESCPALENITIGAGWNVSIFLNYSNKLTVESLHGMIENLADLTGQTAKTFKIGSTNLAKIDAEHLAMLQNKNWNYS